MLPTRAKRNENGYTSRPLNVFDRWAGTPFGLFDEVFQSERQVGFPVDIRHEGEMTIVEAELPGVKKENLDITMDNHVLTISANTAEETDEQKGQYHIRERRSGRVSRSFRLSEDADVDNINAELKDGVLTLRIPVKESAKPRQIEIK